VIVRGKTSDVVHDIAHGEFDFAYIDGDRTLKGFQLILMAIYPKVKSDGLSKGDDFTTSAWEHKTSFVPTMVFPYGVYFAEQSVR
jgi:hypothetical protein